MSPKAQRIAIAEACGWTKCEHVASINLTKGIPPANNPPKYGTYENGMAQLPDYLNNLNAMHEVENKKLVSHAMWDSYLDNLESICEKENIGRYITNATAAQRAESFLKTSNLWKP